MALRLRITEGEDVGREYLFTRDIVNIGRLPTNDVVLEDVSVSRWHCQIMRSGAGFTLRDTSSANGTLVNAEPMLQSRIASGDIIRIGAVALEVSTDEEGTAEGTRLTQLDLKRLKKLSLVPPQVDESKSSLSRSWKFNVGIVAALVLLSLAVHFWRSGSVGSRRDRSNDVFALNQTAQRLRYGAGDVDVFTPDRANFGFEYHGGQVKLSMVLDEINSPDEVAILINSQHLRFVPSSVTGPVYLIDVPVDSRLLGIGTNLITIDNTKNVAHSLSETWRVMNIVLTESE